MRCILKELGENLVVASSGREGAGISASGTKSPSPGRRLACPSSTVSNSPQWIREHPRFQKTAMIFKIFAIQVSDIDRLRGYEMGAVDYVRVPSCRRSARERSGIRRI